MPDENSLKMLCRSSFAKTVRGMYSGTVAQKNCILLFAGVYWEAPEEK